MSHPVNQTTMDLLQEPFRRLVERDSPNLIQSEDLFCCCCCFVVVVVVVVVVFFFLQVRGPVSPERTVYHKIRPKPTG